MYKDVVKVLIDRIVAAVAIVLLLPIMLFVTILLILFQNGEVFFTQKRPGKNETEFSLIKFKTMTDQRDDKGKLLPDAERMTKIGAFIRKTSLDELPQLFNVFLGQMSLVGPRPLLTSYLPLYSYDQKRRHEVTPGITGWAQINGRNDISWEKKFELDVWYVDNVSLLLDIRILLLTVKKVLEREGVNKHGEATTEAFNGKN